MKTRSRDQDRAAVISFESGRSAASGQAAQAFGSGSETARPHPDDFRKLIVEHRQHVSELSAAAQRIQEKLAPVRARVAHLSDLQR
jgi:hypothetical protein